jgi:hypothetical protein
MVCKYFEIEQQMNKVKVIHPVESLKYLVDLIQELFDFCLVALISLCSVVSIYANIFLSKYVLLDDENVLMKARIHKNLSRRENL